MKIVTITLVALFSLPAFADSHEKACAMLNRKMNNLAGSAEKKDPCEKATSKACLKLMEKMKLLFAEAAALGDCDFDVLDAELKTRPLPGSGNL